MSAFTTETAKRAASEKHQYRGPKRCPVCRAAAIGKCSRCGAVHVELTPFGRCAWCIERGRNKGEPWNRL